MYYHQSDVDYSIDSINSLGDSPPEYLTGEEVDVLRGRYIRRLTAVLIHHIPAFWRVALSVFSGKFAKVFWKILFHAALGIQIHTHVCLSLSWFLLQLMGQ